MTVYLSGEVQASSCKPGKNAEARLIDILSEDEVAKLDEWLSKYGNVTLDASDPVGVADRMVITLSLMGTGTQKTLAASNEEELLNFAQELHQRVQQ